jgi:hypothetical protein
MLLIDPSFLNDRVKEKCQCRKEVIKEKSGMLEVILDD